jgi:DNA polymerase
MNRRAVKCIQELRALLAYHQIIGIEEYPDNEEIRHFLRVARPVPVAALSRSAGRATPTVPTMPPSRPVPVSTETLDDIRLAVQDCRACGLHGQRVRAVAGRGGLTARLLIVGEWLKSPGQMDMAPDMVFGAEEDRMLARMLEAIHLSPQDVFVTNILKCGLLSSWQPPTATVVASSQICLTYLRRQIAALAPQLICTMGILPTRALLGPSSASRSLSQLRGHFHHYTTPDGRQIPLMPTYHPAYLLQATSMKEATWKDLQLIARHLGG